MNGVFHDALEQVIRDFPPDATPDTNRWLVVDDIDSGRSVLGPHGQDTAVQLFVDTATDLMCRSSHCSVSCVDGTHPDGTSSQTTRAKHFRKPAVSESIVASMPPLFALQELQVFARGTATEGWRGVLHAAVINGDTSAQHGLAFVLLKGIGIEQKDGNEAEDGIKWLRTAAGSGDADAQQNLAFSFFS